MNTITLTKPDDWHLHLRDGAYLKTTVPFAAQRFARAMIMPNLTPPITTVDAALAYRERITAHIPPNSNFQPLMALFLTETTSTKTLITASEHPDIIACKLYPAGATTHSKAGIKNIEHCYPLFEVMEKHELPLSIHGEVADATDIFDREKVFLEKHLAPIVTQFPHLKIILEHVSTREGVQFVQEGPDTLAATITAHHLLLNRNDLFNKGLRPHNYCLPVPKRADDQAALIAAATQPSKQAHKFFLGTDSAPHPQHQKESDCGCAGIFTSHAAIELYTEGFEDQDALNHLEAFASFNGADFYGVPRNQEKITLQQKNWQVPGSFSYGSDTLIPFRANNEIRWQLK